MKISSFRSLHRLLMGPRNFSVAASNSIYMPDIMDSKNGRIEKWLKREGDQVNSGETICEVSLEPSSLMVGVESPVDGFLAEIVVRELKSVDAKTIIAKIVASKEEYMSFLDEQREEDIEDTKCALTSAELEKQTKGPDMKVLLREIKHLIQTGEIEDGSDLSRQLLSHARKGNQELMSIFEASFEGVAFNKETFDKQFFIDNARDMIKEESKS